MYPGIKEIFEFSLNKMSSELYIKLKMTQNKLQILNLKLILMLLVQFRIIFIEQPKEENYRGKNGYRF